MQEPLIGARDFWWRYEGSSNYVIKGISFNLHKGEVLGLVGPTGAGKTTLILSLLGIIPQRIPGAFKGMIKIKGKAFDTTPIHKITESVSAVFQDPDSQFVSMSVLDELVFGMENVGLEREEISKRLNHIVNLLGLNDILDKHPYELSGGQKQKVAIASALVLKPEILLLDEPTTDLDPISRAEVFSTINELKKIGQTMVIVEHEADELCKVADRLILLNEGKILKKENVKEFYSQVPLLSNIGITSPQPTELFYKLWERIGEKGRIPLTVDEAIKIIKELNLNKEKVEDALNELKEHEVIKEGNLAINVQNLTYIYPDGTLALKDVSLRIYEEEYVAIIGQNGSGKTTLAKHLNGLLKPTKGLVKIFGKDTRKFETAELAHLVGHCFQNPDHQLFSASVKEEIALGPRALKKSKEEIKKIVKEIVEIMDLKGFENEHPFFLGKGERLRLAVAFILSMRPKILVIDEPTTGQDYKHAKSLMKHLDELNRKGITIIVITHHMRYVAEHAKRVVVMKDGKIILDEPTRKAFSLEDKLRDAGLEPPTVTKIFKLANFLGNKLPITVDEGVDILFKGIMS